MNVNQGECIFLKGDFVNDLIELLSISRKSSRERAKQDSSTNGHFFIVMDKPKLIGNGRRVQFSLVHCTKSVSSYFRKKILRPLPCKYAPAEEFKCFTDLELLKLEEGSAHLREQTYAVPVRITKVELQSDCSQKVSVSVILQRISC